MLSSPTTLYPEGVAEGVGVVGGLQAGLQQDVVAGVDAEGPGVAVVAVVAGVKLRSGPAHLNVF